MRARTVRVVLVEWVAKVFRARHGVELGLPWPERTKRSVLDRRLVATHERGPLLEPCLGWPVRHVGLVALRHPLQDRKLPWKKGIPDGLCARRCIYVVKVICTRNKKPEILLDMSRIDGIST